MKKILSLALAILMVIAVFAGCTGGGDDGGDVTLKWAIGFSEQADYPQVLEKINEELQTLLPNTKLEFILDSQIASKWSLWMAGGTIIDIAHSGYHTDLYTEIGKKSYMSLNKLIEEYAPNIAEEWEYYDVEFAGGTYQGDLYAIPNIQYHTDQTSMLNIPYELADHLDLDALIKEVNANRKTTAKLYDILDEYLNAVFSKNLVNTDKISDIIDINRLFDLSKRGYDFLGGKDSNLCYDVDDDSCTIIDFHTTDEFKTFLEYAEKWYKAGYISKDVLAGGGPGSRSYVLQYAGRNRGNIYVDDIDSDVYFISKDSATAADTMNIEVNPLKFAYLGASELGTLATYTSIPATSKYPERAMKLLNILHSEEGRDLMNLICYGIEGEHYEVASEGFITPFEYKTQGSSSSSYGIPNWMIGNIFYADVCSVYNQGYVDYAVSYFENRLENIERTKLFGFSLNMDKISAELTQLKAVCTEYETQLISGSLTDADSTYKNMMSKTEAAGLSNIMKEFQKQVDEYIK